MYNGRADQGPSKEETIGQTSRTFLTIYCIIMIICGLGCMGVGIWMHADKDVTAYLYVLRRSPHQSMLLSAAGILIAAGILLIGMAIMGIFGVMKRNRILLTLVVLLLVIILILQMAVGFGVLAFRDDIHKYVKRGMKAQVEEFYQWDNPTGLAWNRVQVRERCCGVDGSWDYQFSNWWYGQNPGIEKVEEAEIHVPTSCCKLEFNQDRDIERVDPQNPAPKDPVRCQLDAMGRMDGSDNLNGRGCFAALLSFIYTHIYVLMGMGIGLAAVQVFGIIIAVLALQNTRKEV